MSAGRVFLIPNCDYPRCWEIHGAMGQSQVADWKKTGKRRSEKLGRGSGSQWWTKRSCGGKRAALDFSALENIRHDEFGMHVSAARGRDF
jgi:hypothetical protein